VGGVITNQPLSEQYDSGREAKSSLRLDLGLHMGVIVLAVFAPKVDRVRLPGDRDRRRVTHTPASAEPT
jgi:hypothetical protein